VSAAFAVTGEAPAYAGSSGVSAEELISDRGGQTEVRALKKHKGVSKFEQSLLCRLLQDSEGPDYIEMAARCLSTSCDFVHEHSVNARLRSKLDCLALAEIKFV
jgi:hypothetical protein